jgi:hypothetical protein
LEVLGKGGRRVKTWSKKCVHMYVNAKMKSLQEWKEEGEWWRR